MMLIMGYLQGALATTLHAPSSTGSHTIHHRHRVEDHFHGQVKDYVNLQMTLLACVLLIVFFFLGLGMSASDLDAARYEEETQSAKLEGSKAIQLELDDRTGTFEWLH